MNLSGPKWMLVSIFIVVPVLVRAQDAAQVSNEDPVWQPASVWDAGARLPDSEQVPADYNPMLLTLGRSVYADLQRARQAVLHKESGNLDVALEEAEDTLHRLQLPANVMALDAQLQVIRNDLHDWSKQPDAGLWVPVEAEISKVLVYAPDELGSRTTEAVRKGRTAAANGDRQTAAGQLDVITNSMQYSLGIFPLNKVRTDLAAALAAAKRAPPDWDGALKAVQNSLATFHWYTQEPANTLLSAYADVTHAFTLAQGMYSQPEWWRRVRDYLARTQALLADTPDDWGLSTRAQDAIYQLERHRDNAVAAIKSLLNALQSQILQQRQQAEDRYRGTLIPTVAK